MDLVQFLYTIKKIEIQVFFIFYFARPDSSEKEYSLFCLDWESPDYYALFFLCFSLSGYQESV